MPATNTEAEARSKRNADVQQLARTHHLQSTYKMKIVDLFGRVYACVSLSRHCENGMHGGELADWLVDRVREVRIYAIFSLK